MYHGFEGDELKDDDVKLDWSETSMKLEVVQSDQKHVLHVGTLHNSIEGCSVKVKPNKLVLTLKKSKGATGEWPGLAKQNVIKTEEDGICIDGR